MKKNILLLLSFLTPVALFAQFNEAIGTYKDQIGYSVQRTKFDPGYIVAGTDGQAVFGQSEAVLSKTNLSGVLQWTIDYGGIGLDTFYSVRQIYAHTSVPFDGYAALGSTSSFTNNEDVYFVRTDSAGNPTFSFIFGRKEGIDKGRCLQYIKDTATGRYGYVIAGQSNSYPYYGYSTDILVIKTDEDGNLVKAKVIGSPNHDVANWIEQTKDGGFILTGYTTRSSGSADRDIVVIRLDKDLKIVWQYIFKHCEVSYPEDEGYSVVENPLDGSFTVTGVTSSFGISNKEDAFLLNLNSAGAVNWMKTYGKSASEGGLSVRLSNGGKEYVVSGYAMSDSSRYNAWFFKTDMAGNTLWSNIYGQDSGPVEIAREITDNAYDGYAFAGVAEADYTINKDLYLVSLTHDGASNGCQYEYTKDWKLQKPCTYSYFQDVEVSDLKMVCTQYQRVSYQVRKCDNPSGSALEKSQAASNDAFSVVPNPASSAINIVFTDSATPKGGTIVIYNRSGKIVQKITTTSQDTQVPVHGLPDDLYVIHFITTDGNHYQKRFIKK